MRTAEKLHYQRFTAIVHILPVSPVNVTALVRSGFLFHFHTIACIEYPTKPVYNCFDIRTLDFF